MRTGKYLIVYACLLAVVPEVSEISRFPLVPDFCHKPLPFRKKSHSVKSLAGP
jgi:hypothetical protein